MMNSLKHTSWTQFISRRMFMNFWHSSCRSWRMNVFQQNIQKGTLKLAHSNTQLDFCCCNFTYLIIFPFQHRIDFISRQTTPTNRIFGGWLLTECRILFIVLSSLLFFWHCFVLWIHSTILCSITGVCTSCAYVSKTFSPFTSLSLNIAGVSSVQDAVKKHFLSDSSFF